MAVCEFCNREMKTADSCIKVPVPIKHGDKVVKELEPVRFGDERRYPNYVVEAHERCHDCNVKKGEYHHVLCDVEECPNCHSQMIGCGGECGGRVN